MSKITTNAKILAEKPATRPGFTKIPVCVNVKVKIKNMSFQRVHKLSMFALIVLTCVPLPVYAEEY